MIDWDKYKGATSVDIVYRDGGVVMDYENMSDFEINKVVAEAYGLLIQELDDSTSLGMTTDFHEKYPSVVWVAHTDHSTWRQCEPWWQFDPCNNPSDAWPIIVENKIDIEFIHDENSVTASVYCYKTSEFLGWHNCENPLRAAMIVYLMMQEQSNETQS